MNTSNILNFILAFCLLALIFRMTIVNDTNKNVTVSTDKKNKVITLLDKTSIEEHTDMGKKNVCASIENLKVQSLIESEPMINKTDIEHRGITGPLIKNYCCPVKNINNKISSLYGLQRMILTKNKK